MRTLAVTIQAIDTQDRRASERHDVATDRWHVLPVALLWVLMLFTFSAPGRAGPDAVGELDWIALLKVATRAGGIVVVGWCFFQFRDTARQRRILIALAPWILFAGWALLTVLWSPLRSVTIGQSASLVAQLALIAAILVTWQSSADLSWLLKHLAWGLTAMATIIVMVHLLRPELGGLTRYGGINGMVHPTSAGATASLGLVLVTAARLIWNWDWSRRLLVPAVVIHSLLLYFAASRTALGMAIIVVALLIYLYADRRFLAVSLLCGSALAAGYIALDPGFRTVEQTLGTTGAFLSRGETRQSLGSFTGRTVLWQEVIKEFRKSPLRGHGYFVTSDDGTLDVWSGPANRTAHNVWLQVLVSTGVIGSVLFGWALWRSVCAVWKARRVDPEWKKTSSFLIAVGIWYAGWGLLCSSFMGPIQPESVVFFVCYAIALVPHVQRPGAELGSISGG